MIMSKLSEGIWNHNAAFYLLGGGGDEGRRLKTSSYSVVARKGDKKVKLYAQQQHTPNVGRPWSFSKLLLTAEHAVCILAS